MFKNHPKGLLAAALANMGERFGFYTMMAILLLFLQSKYALDTTSAGLIYSVFYALIYLLALVGGIVADKTKNFKGTILVGLCIMAFGYVLMAIPSPTPVQNKVLFLGLTLVGLFTIAFGNGLFKGNLQALVGKMYDKPEYSKMRDAGFSLFYMFINVGAIFAPLMAVGIRNWWVAKAGFVYKSELPALCHSYLAGKTESATQLSQYASEVGYTDITLFAKSYLNVFNEGFNWAFGVAIFAMAISLVVYLVNKKYFPTGNEALIEATKVDANGKTVAMEAKEIRQRMYALFAVFGVVIFFWFSFHQNGLTLTKFAQEYTDLSMININLGFTRIQGAEIFQSFNPLCVVLLTPVVMALFGWLSAKGKEPSTPKKIAIGMGIAALGFVVMAVGSYFSNIPLNSAINPDLGGTPLTDAQRVTPFLLIGTYVILTIAELFISPLGISFVSRVAPPKYQGLMQGLWLCATAVGNQLLFIGAILYSNIPIWLTWTVFVIVCTISMMTMIFMLKWLERVAK